VYERSGVRILGSRMAHDVFISHSSKDKQTADAVCAILESKTIRCWVAPRDIQPGADWGESIIEGIRGSRVMVLIFSKHANESVQIKREVERAVHHGIPIIPLRIEDILPTGALEYSISTAHWLDAFTPPMERHLTYLADTVQAILQGKPKPQELPPLPPSRPAWVNPAIGAGVAVGALLLYLLTMVLFPPSVRGDWNLSQATLSSAQNSVISDLITAAITGSNIKGQLQVKTLNEYTASITATDSGTVKSNDTALTFTFLDNSGGRWTGFGVPAGEKLLEFGVNAGAGEVFVHGNPTGGNSGAGQVDPAVVGTWAGTPFNLNPPNNLWPGTLVINADGTYVITVTHQEAGLLDASNGNWSAKPGSANSPNGMPMSGMYSGLFFSGHYSFSGSNTLNIATDNGNFTFKRGW